LFSLEEKLRPPHLEHPWPRDSIGVGLLIALAAVMYPQWQVNDDFPRFLTDIAGQMASFYLLPALGLCLALRCGAIDLSVWASAALAGLVTAWMINAGCHPAWAFAGACGAGLAVGAVNGSLVAFARLPSPIVTLVAALVIMWSVQGHVKGRQVAVPAKAFANWHLSGTAGEKAPIEPDPAGPAETDAMREWLPIKVTRMLVIGLGYAAVMAGLLAADAASRRGVRFGRRLSLFAALCASGLLCGIAGACWVIEYGNAPALTRPIGDLRVLAAPILAGAWFFGGRSRSLLAGLCLPVALLMATIWWQVVWAWNMELKGYSMQLVQLAAMLIAAHLAIAHLQSRRFRYRWLAAAGAALTVGGILVTAGIAWAGDFRAVAALYVAGLGLWGCGVSAIVVSRLLARRQLAAGEGHRGSVRTG